MFLIGKYKSTLNTCKGNRISSDFIGVVFTNLVFFFTYYCLYFILLNFIVPLICYNFTITCLLFWLLLILIFSSS